MATGRESFGTRRLQDRQVPWVILGQQIGCLQAHFSRRAHDRVDAVFGVKNKRYTLYLTVVLELLDKEARVQLLMLPCCLRSHYKNVRAGRFVLPQLVSAAGTADVNF
jgi:hypothetical protein